MNELTALAERLSSEDPNYFLGRLLWYSMGHVRIPQPECAKMLVSAGFTAKPPPMPRDEDVFKRVCKATKREKVPTADPDVFENYLLVSFPDNEYVTRRVVRQRVDNKGRKLGHDELLDIILERSTSQLTTQHVGTAKCEGMCQDIVAEITSEFSLWRGHLNTYAVREWMRGHILKMGATMVRPGGGVYFLQEALLPEIESLESFSELAAGYGRIELHSLPLVDDRKQRAMVRQAFEAETTGALNKLLMEVAELNRSGMKITPRKFKALFKQYRELLGKTKDYEALLEQTLATTGSRLDIFQDALLQLQTNIED